jgi:hypothetical protein
MTELINVINIALGIFCCLFGACVLYTSNNGPAQYLSIIRTHLCSGRLVYSYVYLRNYVAEDF